VPPNPSLNTDVLCAGLRPRGGPPVSSIPLGLTSTIHVASYAP